MARQVELVRAVVEEFASGVRVDGCLCFIAPEGLLAESGLPAIRTLQVNGYSLLYPKRVAKRLNQPGALSADQIHSVAAILAERFPAKR